MSRHDRLERVNLLTSLLLDGLASPEEESELNRLLGGDPETCERYLDLAEAHALLVQEHAGEDLAANTAGILPFATLPPLSGRPRAQWERKGRWRLLAAAAAIALLANAYVLWNRGGPATSEEPSQDTGVAVLSRVVDPVWAEGEAVPAVGSSIGTGTLSLRSGLVQVEFFSGATLIVEGPAELELESAWRVVCRSGRLRAFVPEPAQGFTIAAPDYEAVDLGTEFALSVSSNGLSEVHVLDGEVRLDSADGRELRHLGAGAAIRSSSGELTEIESRGEAFVDRQALLQLANDDWRSRYAAWKNQGEVYRGDPATLAYFNFEDQDPWDRALANRATNRAPGLPGGGAIIGAQWTQGRWPGKGALEFKRVTDRVRLRIPGDYEALSLATWVRAEGFERWLNSLILTDGWETGEVHWQISSEGELILGVSGGANAFSPPVIHPGDLGRWMHLAVTVDGRSERGRIVHYLDGRPVAELVSEDPFPPLRIGDAEIGNWQHQGQGHPIRSLNGRIDDFLILSRVLSPEEIAAMHEAGVANR